LASPRRFRRRLLVSGSRSGAGNREGLRGRRPMYITYFITLGFARLRLVSFVLVMPMRSLVSFYGDVDEDDGGGGFFCITGWRYVIHLSEKSGWCLLSRCGGLFPFWDALSADDSGSPASLEAAVPGVFGDATANGRQILPVRSMFQVQIEAFDVPIVTASKKNLKLLRRDGNRFQAASSSCLSVSRGGPMSGGSDRR